MKKISTLFFLCGALTVVAPHDSLAGELVNSPRISSSSTIGDRDIKRSTFAVRSLSRGFGSWRGKSLPLRSSNPFEARILDHQRAQAKYELQYARWELRAAKAEEAQDRREERDRARQIEKQRREIERAKREERRLARAARPNILGALTGDEENTESIDDERNRRAESFFGTEKISPEKKEKPRLSFWQRLKRALFGS